MSRPGRASSGHLRRLRVVPLAITAAVAIAACGGGGAAKPAAAVKASPAALVSQSFSASDAISSGRVALDVALSLDGVKQLGGKPATLDISGPFQRGADGLSTDLTANIAIGSSTAKIGIDRVAKTTYLGIDGAFYELPAGALTGATGATGTRLVPSHATGATGMLATLGIDPKSLLSDPHIVGTADVAGVTTEHLTAQIDIPNVLNDIAHRLPSSGTSTGSSGAISPTSVLELLQSAITKATVDIYTGVSDHIVRKFQLAIAFTVPPIAAGVVGGLTGGSLNIDATLSDLGVAQTISPPANPQPSSKLLNGVFALESRFGSLASLAAGLTGGGSNFGGLFSSSSSTASSSASSG